MLGTSRSDRTAPRVRELSGGDDSAYDCSPRLSHPRPVDFPDTIHDPRNRCGWGTHFAVARAGLRLVSLVVVEANQTSLSVDDANPLRHQSYSGSWNGARQARSSICGDRTRGDRDLRRVEPASRSRWPPVD